MNPIWFHCNRCGRNDQNVNNLASCGHILCHQCFDCQSPICPIKTCKQNIRVKAIGPELMNDPDLAMLFQHGSDAVQKVGHSWQVQMSQFMHLVEHLTRVKNQKLAELEKADQTLKDLEAELASKRAWKEQEEKKIQLRSATAAQFIQTTPEGSTISNRFSNEISTSFQSPYFNNPGTVDRMSQGHTETLISRTPEHLSNTSPRQDWKFQTPFWNEQNFVVSKTYDLPICFWNFSKKLKINLLPLRF